MFQDMMFSYIQNVLQGSNAKMPHRIIARHIAPRQGDRQGAEAGHGIGFPRLYDFLLKILTRGREGGYRTAILDLAGIAPGDRVLDIGCGTGTQAIASWQRSQPGGQVTGIDISAKMLDSARRKTQRADADIAFREADAAALPFDDASFDVVTITTVLHMMPENRQAMALEEASRVLTSRGRLVVIDYAGTPEERSHWSARHGRHGRFDLNRLAEPLRRAGFGAVEAGRLGWLSLHYLRGTKA
jgi:SAM-dependent methyltransferase